MWIFHERDEILGWSTQDKIKIIMSKGVILLIDSCEALISSFFFFFLMMMNVLSRVLIETEIRYKSYEDRCDVCFRVVTD